MKFSNQTLTNIELSIRSIEGKNISIIQNDQDPSHIGYINILTPKSPQTFDDLSHFYFKTNHKVVNGISNISVIESRNVYCKYSRSDYLQFNCKLCNFHQIWIKSDYWYCSQYQPHSCPPNKKRHLQNYVDEAIDIIGVRYAKTQEGFNRVFSLVKHGCNKRRLQKRISERFNRATGIINRMTYWEMIPSYLEMNMANGGISSLLYENDSQNVVSFAMIPQYGVLLLKSECILPVLLVDGIFQCGIARGTLIIVSSISGNRTSLPIAWAWAASENSDCVSQIFEMIKELRDDLQTIISDESMPIISGVKRVFPNINHQICAWHVSKNLPINVRSIFWKLCKSEHPIQFMKYLTELIYIEYE